MKKMFVVTLVIVAALVTGCSKKQAKTTPTPDTKTEPGKDGSMGGATYGTPAPAPTPDPCAAPAPAPN